MKKFNTINQILYTFIFILIITVPALYTILSEEKSVNIENRAQNNMPSLALLRNGKIGEYIRLMQDYFVDIYKWKDDLIYINSILDYKIFNVSSKDSVTIGKDGWLFYTAEDGVNMRDYYGSNLFSDSDLNKISSNIQSINKNLEKKNIEFIIMMAPNKHTLYEEYLPDRIYNKKGDKTRADQYSTILNSMDIKYIDLRDIMMKEKNNSDKLLYYPLDSHWNDFAGMIAYNELVENLDSKPTYKSKLPKVTIGERDRTGDLGNILFLSTIIKDINISVEKHNNYTKSEINNKNINQITTTNLDGDNRKVLVFKDSFIGAIEPFLSSTFSEVIYNASPIIDFDLISKHNPDIVILQFVERYSNILLQNGNKL